jgi:hypothetical protein
VKTVKFYGASDDLIEASGIDGADEFSPTSFREDGADRGSFLIEAAPFSMLVHGFYGPGAVWSFAPAMVDDGVPLPPWPIRITSSSDCPYSTELQIDVPDHATMRQVVHKRGEWVDKNEESIHAPA